MYALFFTFPVTAAQKLLKSVKIDIVTVKYTLSCFHGSFFLNFYPRSMHACFSWCGLFTRVACDTYSRL